MSCTLLEEDTAKHNCKCVCFPVLACRVWGFGVFEEINLMRHMRNRSYEYQVTVIADIVLTAGTSFLHFLKRFKFILSHCF